MKIPLHIKPGSTDIGDLARVIDLHIEMRNLRKGDAGFRTPRKKTGRGVPMPTRIERLSTLVYGD